MAILWVQNAFLLQVFGFKVLFLWQLFGYKMLFQGGGGEVGMSLKKTTTFWGMNSCTTMVVLFLEQEKCFSSNSSYLLLLLLLFLLPLLLLQIESEKKHRFFTVTNFQLGKKRSWDRILRPLVLESYFSCCTTLFEKKSNQKTLHAISHIAALRVAME